MWRFLVLKDPSVAAAPLEKRMAFLQSKNLTQEEINAALSRAGQASGPVAPPMAPPQGYPYQPSPPGYGYPGGYWPPPPPE